MKQTISLKGAREHNLKNISVEIPRNKVTCLVGVSGSGKSTLANNVIAAEAQRQYFESISTFAARYLKKQDRPDVDSIEGLSPVILVEQKQMRGSPRSTVGTSTEIYTYLRLLFSRVGSKKLSAGHFSFNNPKGACSRCKGSGIDVVVDVDSLVDYNKSLAEGAVNHPNYNRPDTRMMNILQTTDKVPFDIPVKDLSSDQLDFLLYSPHVKLQNDKQGFVQSYSWEGIVKRIIKRNKDLRGISKTKERKDKKYLTNVECKVCQGSRLNQKALEAEINENNIGYYANLPASKLLKEINSIKHPLAKEIVKKMTEQLHGLLDVGIGYVSLNRSMNTLSGGEAQRVKLARELGTELIEMIYVLDEPTSGLHPRDISNLTDILRRIRDSGNTVLVVEHDEKVMLEADHVIELGPGAGRLGGEVTFSGTPNELVKSNTITGKYLKNSKIAKLKNKHRQPTSKLKVENASLHNLKNLSIEIPVGIFTAITGVSGSGKSTLINDIFAKKYSDIVILIDQSPVGSTPRGNIATYVGAFDYIRDLFASENKVSKSLFSSLSTGGCEECKGLGYKKIDMHFMSEMKLFCEACSGKRFKPEVLKYKYLDKNIVEIMDMTVEEASKFFTGSNITKRLNILSEVGLDYLEMEQTLDTLSGGESQRLKLASKLHKNGQFYILDEPTTGLHFADIEKLLILLHKLVDQGNSVLVIEHNLDVIKSADWIIDLGPEGGDQGGKIVAKGTPEDVIKVKDSYTGQYLKI